MKKFSRILACVLLLAMSVSVLGMQCYAADGESAEEPEYTKIGPDEFAWTSLGTINGILKDSISVGVKQIKQTDQHAAVLMGDGTVRAFFIGPVNDWRSYKDYGQCKVSSWENIQAIACGESCTYGLTEDGTLVWAGVPSDSNYAEDAGWAKITAGKGYTDIVSFRNTLFALHSNGKIDVAFKPETDTKNNSRREMCDEVEKLENIIDIEDLGRRSLYALNSSGEIRSTEWDKTVGAVGAAALKVRESAVCAVMSTGEYKIIDDPYSAYLPDFNAVSGPDVPDLYEEVKSQIDINTITHIWCLESMPLGENLFFTEDGRIGRIWTKPGGGVERTASTHWCCKRDELQNVYVFTFTLPVQYMEGKDEPYIGEGLVRYRLDVVLCLKENGECLAHYDLTNP